MLRINGAIASTVAILAMASWGVHAQTPPGKSDAKKAASVSAGKAGQTNNFGGDEWQRKGGVKGNKPAQTQGKVTAQDDWKPFERASSAAVDYS